MPAKAQDISDADLAKVSELFSEEIDRIGGSWTPTERHNVFVMIVGNLRPTRRKLEVLNGSGLPQTPEAKEYIEWEAISRMLFNASKRVRRREGSTHGAGHMEYQLGQAASARASRLLYGLIERGETEAPELARMHPAGNA